MSGSGDITNLCNLMQYLKVSQNGYLECADNTISIALKNMFLIFSRNRQQMLHQIKKTRVNQEFLGKNKDFEKFLRRYFAKLNKLLVLDSIRPAVLEIKYREYALIQSYQKSLKSRLPFNFKKLLSNHLDVLEKDFCEIDKI